MPAVIATVPKTGNTKHLYPVAYSLARREVHGEVVEQDFETTWAFPQLWWCHAVCPPGPSTEYKHERRVRRMS